MKITDEELRTIMTETAKAAVAEYRKQESKDKRRNKYHDTFSLMKCYRDAVFHKENAVSEADQLELEGMTDEQKDTYLRSVRRTKFKTMLMLDHINKAVDEIEKRRKDTGKEIEYLAFDMYFMQGIDYQQIAEELETGKNTPRRWITSIINELSVLLWGLEDDRKGS